MSHDRERKPGSATRVASIQRRGLDPGRRAPTDALQRRRDGEPSVRAGADADARSGRAIVGDVHEDDAWLLLPSTCQAMASSDVQLRGADGAEATTDVHAAAAAGVATPSAELPHRGRLESSFGVDLSNVKAHVGGGAGVSAEAIGAEAYATGDHVVLPESPSLHLVAHEVAHVLQQRDGVQLAGGVGQAGDPYERAADEVADAVERGEPIDRGVDGGRQAPAAGTVQLKEREGQEAPRRRQSQEPSPELATFLAAVDADRFPVFPTEPTIDGAWVTETHVHVVPSAGPPPPLAGDGVEVSWALIDASGEMNDGGRFRWLGGAPTAPAFRVRVATAGRFTLRIDIVDDGDICKQVSRPLVIRHGDSARAAATLPRAEASRAAAAMSNDQVEDQATAVRGRMDAYARRTGADLSDDVEYQRLRGALSEVEWQAHARETSGATVDAGAATDAAGVDGRTFDFTDRGAIRAELERIIAERGISGAREHIAALSQRSTPAASRQTPTALLRFWQPFFDELKVYEEEQAALRGQFESAARPVALGLLAESEGRIRAELERYGLKAGVSEHVGPEGHMKERGADDRELDGLAAAARRVVTAHQQLTAAQQGQASGERPAADVDAMRAALDATKREALQEHPMLQVLLHGGQHSETPDVFQAAKTDGQLLSGPIGWELNKKLADIATCRENLGSGKLSVFGIPRVVELAKAQLHIVPGTMQDGLINEEVARAGHGGWTDALLAVFALGLGLLLAVPTGGSSVVAAGAVTAGELALLATDLYLIGKDLQRYDALRSASNTDLSPVQSLIDEEPSAAGLIIAIATAPVGGRSVVRGVEAAAEAVQRVRALRKAVAAAGGNLADARVVAIGDELVRFAGPAIGPDRADDLRATILRGGDAPAHRSSGFRDDMASIDELRETNVARLAEGRLGQQAVVAYVRDVDAGHDIMRRLAANDRTALRDLGVDFPADEVLNLREWALGRQRWNGKVLIIHGALDGVDPRALDGVELLAHSHPAAEQNLLLSGAAASGGGQSIDELMRLRNVDLFHVLPSLPDFHASWSVGQRRHVVFTPYTYLGNGRIGNQTLGQPTNLPTLEIVMDDVTRGSWAGNRAYPFYRANLKFVAGGEVVRETPIFIRARPSERRPFVEFSQPGDFVAGPPIAPAPSGAPGGE